MEVKRISGDLADPAADAWAAVATETVGLSAIPLDAQPTEYIRVAWADRPYGKVASADVAAAHDGERLYVRVQWADSDTPNTEFHDAAGVLFPADGADAPVATIGGVDAPVRLWYWQANLDAARDLDARGPGVFAKRAEPAVDASAALADGRWSVVLSSGLDAAVTRLGVAVWDGSNEERAGIGAVTHEWIPLEVEN